MDKILYTMICGGAIARAASEAQITVPQAYILSFCADAGKEGVRQKDFEEMLDYIYSLGTGAGKGMSAKISINVKELLEWGYLENREDPQDRRARILTITDGEPLKIFQAALKSERMALEKQIADGGNDAGILKDLETAAETVAGALGW
jgi:hypothetical protein